MGLIRPTVGIVGGTGFMGSWMARLLKGQGLEVICSSRRTELKPAEMAKRCDVVVISVPIENTVNVIKEIGPLVPEKGLLMDLTSVKKAPVEAMLKYSRADVLGLHPLFGPDRSPGSGLRIAICPGRGEEGLKWISGILYREGFELSYIEPEEHDRMMGLIQGVNHFATLALALCIRRSGFSMKEMEKNSTLTFHRRLDRIKSLLGQPAELYGSLLMDNPYTADFIEQFKTSIEDLIRITGEDDKEVFMERFKSLKSFFQGQDNGFPLPDQVGEKVSRE